MLYSSYCNQKKKGAFFMKKLKITDKERKGMKGRRIAFGICAAVLGTAGIGTLLPESVGAYAESYVDENGNDVIKTYPSDPSKAVETTDDETVAASLGTAAEDAWETASDDSITTVVADGQNLGESAKESVEPVGEGEMDTNGYLYKALGMKWNKEEQAWFWNEKPVYAIQIQNAYLTIYGNMDASNATCLYITSESGQGTATFRVEEMTKEEIKKLTMDNE